jgi:hypothetical protein
MRASDQAAQNRATYRQQREEQEQRRRDEVVAEFGGSLERMADEILRCRHAVKQLADAVGWMQKGAPFAVVGPGPHWRMSE